MIFFDRNDEIGEISRALKGLERGCLGLTRISREYVD